MTEEEREAIEQEIRNIKADLTAPVSDIGDWKHIKYNEFLERGLDAPYTKEEMEEYYQARQDARDRINELQGELKKG